MKKVCKFLLKPLKHEFLILSLLFLSTAYFFIGFGLVSRPSLTLFYSRNAGLEAEANIFLKSQGIHCVNPPRVYVLTTNVKNIFHWPYALAFRLLMRINYTGQINESYFGIEDNAIVMQERDAYDPWVLAHETGHIAQFCADPERFARQTQDQKEKFAFDFQDTVQLKFQSKIRPYH